MKNFGIEVNKDEKNSVTYGKGKWFNYKNPETKKAPRFAS
jgi:hypothetical protein